MGNYLRPDAISADMGGTGDQLDARMAGVLELLACAPLAEVERVLDIGFGRGQLSCWLADRGKQVVATGLEIASYGVDVAALRREGIQVAECRAEGLPFADGAFDAVVMSHVLEHCPNVQTALAEVRRILRDGGHLWVFVPLHDHYVCAGHVSMGWNIGQLLYVLLAAGFDVRRGQFIHHAGSVCGFVRKDAALALPPLRGDRGDLWILGQHGLLPLPIAPADGLNDCFRGDLFSLNWEPASAQRFLRAAAGRRRFAPFLSRLVPGRVKEPIGRLLVALGDVLIAQGSGVNPRVLRG